MEPAFRKALAALRISAETPDEIAELVVFLSSDSSRFIDGQVIRIDGGM